MESNKIIAMLEDPRVMPKIPQIVQEILVDLNALDEISMKDLCEKLSLCTDLEYNILDFINNGYFQLARPISSIKQAILALSMNTVRIFIVSQIFKMYIPDHLARTKVFNRRRYWHHILGTAIASEILSEKQSLIHKYALFANGLVHDIGVAVMNVCIPDLLDLVVQTEIDKNIHQLDAEKIVLDGMTHTDIGVWLCRKWHVPEDIQFLIGLHHNPQDLNTASEEMKILYVADLISTDYYESLLGQSFTRVYPHEVLEAIGVKHDEVDYIRKVLHSKVDDARKIIQL